MNECEDCKFQFSDLESEPCCSCDNGSKWKLNKREGLKKITEDINEAVHQFPLFLDPCKYCKYKSRRNEQEREICESCCYYYASKFEME